MSSLSPRDAWRTAVVSITVMLVLTFVLYQQTIVYLLGKWNQLEIGEYGHGYLVLAISAYLIFYNRRRLAAMTPCPEYRAVLAIIVTSMLWMIAALVDIEVLQTISLLLLVLSIIWALLGTQVTKILVFPVLYISFAIPIWFPLSPILQDLTADAVFWMIRVMEIPALRIENMIVLPAGKLSIEEACSGLRYFLAALTLGALYGYLNYVSFRARVFVLLVAVGAAVLANMMRVFIVVYLGYKTDMQHQLVHDHLFLGWYIFAGLVAVLLVIDVQLQRNRLHSSNGATDTAVIKQAPCNKGKSQFMASILVAAIFVSTGPGFIFWISKQPQSDGFPVKIELPPTALEWTYMEAGEDSWNPLYRGAIAHKMAFHDKNNRVMYLYLGMYPTQRQGEELINDLNKISDDKIWRIMYQRAKVYNVNGHQVLEQLLERSDGTQRLVWYWYRVAGQNTVNKYQAKVLQVLGMLKGMRQASIVAIAAKLDGEPEDTRNILGRFAKLMESSIDSVTDSKI